MWPATTDPDPNYKSEIGSLWTDTKYWLRHCLPVIIILYDPELGNLYWQSIEHETAISTGKKWKIRIPKSNIITNDTFTDFFALTQPSPYIQRYNKLLLDRNWISLLTNDEVVYVEFEDWINKSLPRFQIRIGCTTNNDIAEETWPTMYGPGVSIEEAIDYAIPWADYETDPIAHEAFMESKWYGEAVLRYDKEYDQPISSIPFDDWYASQETSEKIMPVSENGETVGFRLILSLNEVGRAFLVLDEYLSRENLLENKLFTLET